MLYQAENAEFTGAVVASNHNGADGSFVDVQGADDAWVEWTVDADAASDYLLQFRYALAGSASRSMGIEINGTPAGEIAFPATGGWGTWEMADLNLPLDAGENTIRLVAIGESGPNLDSLFISAPDTLQAEDATLDGAVEASKHAGAEGGAYVDFTESAGQAITWDVDAEAAGDTTLTLRYALRPAQARTMSLEVNGEIVDDNVTFPSTGDWKAWSDLDIDVSLLAGANTVRLVATGQSGPNVDSLTIGDIETGAGALDDAITLQAEDAALDGVIADSSHSGAQGGAYADYTAASGQSITWTVEADRDGSAPIDIRYALGANDPRVMALAVNGQIVEDAMSFDPTGGWANWSSKSLDLALSAGPNEITLIATGDSGPNIDSLTVGTDDGPQWGEMTDSVDMLEPGETGIAVDSSFAVGIDIDEPGEGLDGTTVNSQTVRLIDLSTGAAVPATVNSTGGGDSISISPVSPLDPDTPYQIVIDGVKAQSGEDYPFLSRSFETGTGSDTDLLEGVSFNRETVSSGDGIASLLFSDDYSQLYAATLTGSILRWDVDADGGLSNKAEIVVEAGQSLIGIAIDPTNPDRIWVTNNEGFSGSAPDVYGSKITYVDITDQAAFTGTVTDYVTGLPRSAHDHLANSLAFGDDGALYFSVGSMTAMGDVDAAWGLRPETPLSAAMLRLDTTASGPIDVSTDGSDPYDPDAPDAPLTVFASGLRNAYDLLFHSNGKLYSADNGSAAGGNSPDDPSTPEDERIENGSTEPDYLFELVEGGYYGHPNATRGEYIRKGGNPTAGVDEAEVTDYAVGTLPDPDFQGVVYNFGNKRSANGMAEYTSTVFGAALQGTILVAEYSQGDRIVGLKLDDQGNVVQDFVLATGFNNPLDVAVHEPSGNVYVANFGSEASLSDDEIILLRAQPDDTGGNGVAVFDGDLIIVEAEDIIESGFTTRDVNVAATNGEVVELVNGETDGVLSHAFEGEDGTYDLTLSVFDETDGEATIEVLVNGETVDILILDDIRQNAGLGAGNLTSLTIEGLALKTGDTLEILGVVDGGEYVRIDKLVFSPGESIAPGGADFEIVNDRTALGMDADVFIFHEAELYVRPQAADTSLRTIEIANTSDEVLTISELEVTGDDFALADPSQAAGAVLQPGESLSVEVLFDADDISNIKTGALVIRSDADSGAVQNVDLRGLWSKGIGGNREPDLDDLIDLMGWATDDDGSIITETQMQGAVEDYLDHVATVQLGDYAVPAGYFEAADKTQAVTIQQVAAFHGVGNQPKTAVVGVDYDISLGDVADTEAYSNPKRLTNFTHEVTHGNTIVPAGKDGTGLALEAFVTDRPFFFRVDGRESDPGLDNGRDAFRILELFDQDSGARLEDTYLIAMDYAGNNANFDYNDNVYVITNVEPFDGII